MRLMSSLAVLPSGPGPRPDAFAAFIRAETAKWGAVARAANVRLEG